MRKKAADLAPGDRVAEGVVEKVWPLGGNYVVRVQFKSDGPATPVEYYAPEKELEVLE